MAWSIAYETPPQGLALQGAAGALGLSGVAPVVGTTMFPAAGALSLVGQAVQAVLAVELIPDTGVLGIDSLPASIVTAQTNIRPPSGALTTAGAAPGIAIFLAAGNPIGANMNFAGIGSIRGEPISTDGIANCRGFNQIGNAGSAVPLSSSGWPTTDFVCILIEGQRGQAWMLGTWKCGFTGTGNETISNNGNGHVTKTSAAGNPNVTFDLVVSGFSDGQIVGNVASGFQVSGTTNGVTQVFAYLPAYAAQAGNKHQAVPKTANEFIALRGNGKCGPIRFMQPQNVIFNNSNCTGANRNTPANCVTGQNAFGTGEFFSQEYCIRIAGDTGCAAWINVPIGADNSYFASMASGIKPFTSAGGGNCGETIIEIGNELWGGNGGAGQNAALVSRSAAYNSANPGVLNYDGNSNAQTLGMRWLATRYHDLAVALQAQFGAAFGTAVKLGFMTQAAGNGAQNFLPTFLSFLVHQYGGSPSQWVHGLGADTYSNRNNTSIPGDSTNWDGTTGSPATIQAEWTRNANYAGYGHFNETFKLWALKYGLKLWSYEGTAAARVDPGLPDASVPAVGAAMTDSGFQAVIANWAQQRFNLGWDRLIHYASGIDIGNGTGNDSASPAYCWGVTESTLIASGSPKYNGIQQFKNGVLPLHRNRIAARGQSILGVNYVNNVVQIQPQNPALTTSGGSGIEGAFNQAWLFQLLAGAGLYDITLNYTGSGATNLYVDGTLISSGIACPANGGLSAAGPVVVCVMENHSFAEIVGNGSAPYINGLIAQGCLLTNYFGVGHPSEPNYFALFSGSTQGVTDDNNYFFPSTTTLCGQLFSAGKTFKGYAETTSPQKHNPWQSFGDSSAHGADFNTFPTNFSLLPTVSFVSPNLADDMHDGTIAQGDTWLKNNLDNYAQWAKTNNGLFILVFDEDDGSESNQVAALVVGGGVGVGTTVGALLNHYSLLRFIEDRYSLSHLANAATASPLALPPSVRLGSVNLTAGFHSLEVGTGSNQAFTVNLFLVN